MDEMLRWLTSLPPAALYVALAVTAALENVFPPLPADTVVAFGSFLAARGDVAAVGAFAATWLGNVTGAMLVFAVFRRWGSSRMRARLRRFAGHGAEQRLDTLYRRRGTAALFLSRFLPGVRAIVPPFAGALKLSPVPVGIVIALASAIWYGLITVAAYQVGANWEALQERVATMTRGAGLVAALVIAALLLGWWLYRRREFARR